MSSIKNIFIFLLIFLPTGNWCLQNSTNTCKPKPIDDLPDLPELFFLRPGARFFTIPHQVKMEEILLHAHFDNNNAHFTSLESIVGYGFSEKFGLAVYIPWASKRINKDTRSSGFGDVFIGTQWHFYYKQPNRAMILAGIGFPTGSISTTPTLGSGVYSWFIELAEAHSSDYWYASSFLRTHIYQPHKKEAIGTRFSYQILAGPKLPLKNGGKILALWEINGIYDAKTKECNKTLFDSGGTLALAGPFIAYEKENLTFEGTIQLPISQNFSEERLRISWVSAFTFKITF